MSAFSDAMMVARNGTALVNKAADALEDLLTRRVKAAENIMRKAEELDKDETPPPDNYVFDHSVVSLYMHMYIHISPIRSYKLN